MQYYPANSPAAVAKIVALSMMADETLHPRELAALDALDPWPELGLSREEFLTVTSETFEERISDMQAHSRAMLLCDLDLDLSVDAVTDPRLQALTYRMVVALLPADGHLAQPELVVLQRILQRWALPDEVVEQALV